MARPLPGRTHGLDPVLPSTPDAHARNIRRRASFAAPTIMNPTLSVGPILVAFALAPLFAQQKELDPKLVQLTVARLGSEVTKAADETMIALIRGDRASVPLLRAVLAAEPNAAAARRARQALRICEIDAPIEKGLKVGLAADVETVKPGDAIRLTTTLCNVSDEPIALYLGMSYSGNVLENGASLARQETPAEKVESTWLQARFGAVGFCGTGAEPIVVRLEPWTTREFATKLEFRTEKKPVDVCDHDGPHLAASFVYLPLDPKQRTVALQTRLEVDAKEADRLGEPKQKANWSGSVRSNVLEVAIGEAKGR